MSFARSNNIRYFILALLVGVNFFAYAALVAEERGTKLTVAFLDVGQGDAIYIEAPDGSQMLIDGGSGAQVLGALAEVMPAYDRSIDVIVATHPDKDHIGGLPLILERFKVDIVVVSGASSDTATYREFEAAIMRSGAKKIVASSDMRIGLDDEVAFDVLFPDTDVSGYKDTNEASIVGMLAYGSQSFLLTGDSPVRIEQRLVARDIDIQADVLKLGHHGSRTSTSAAFLQVVEPLYAIVSAACKNSYGHPHTEVLAALDKSGIQKLSTCESGTIVFETDSDSLSYHTEN